MNRDTIIDELRNYKTLNGGKYGIIEIGVFGSIARGQERTDSDLDVCIETKTPNPFIIVYIKEDLERLFNRRVDIVRLRKTMNAFLKERIEKEAMYA